MYFFVMKHNTGADPHLIFVIQSYNSLSVYSAAQM